MCHLRNVSFTTSCLRARDLPGLRHVGNYRHLGQDRREGDRVLWGGLMMGERRAARVDGSALLSLRAWALVALWLL